MVSNYDDNYLAFSGVAKGFFHAKMYHGGVNNAPGRMGGVPPRLTIITATVTSSRTMIPVHPGARS
jgi:hypothetical protein